MMNLFNLAGRILVAVAMLAASPVVPARVSAGPPVKQNVGIGDGSGSTNSGQLIAYTDPLTVIDVWVTIGDNGYTTINASSGSTVDFTVGVTVQFVLFNQDGSIQTVTEWTVSDAYGDGTFVMQH